MIKLISVFFCVLLAFTAIELHYSWYGSTEKASEYVNPDLHKSLVAPVIPEDTLVFSGSYWRQRTHCQNNEPSYIGFSIHKGDFFAVISTKNDENIYRVGDSLPADEQARIMYLDEKTVVLRYPDRVEVLCNDDFTATQQTTLNTNVSPSVTHTDISQQDKSAPTIEYSSRLGVIIPIVSDKGITTGYQIKKCLQYCWVMRRFMLREGDIIISVQGNSVGEFSPQQIMSLLTSTESDVELTLIRNDKYENVIIPWEKISPLVKFMNKGLFL